MMLFRTLVPLLLLISGSLAQTCYFSNGSKAAGYSACNNSTEHSSCCLLYQQDGTPVDLCTTNGLCLSRSSVYNGFIFQSACTDPTWQSGNCPQACPTSSLASSTIVQPCNASSGGLWCCRQDGSPDCCGSAKKIAIGQLILPSSSSTSSSAPPSSTSALSAPANTTVTTSSAATSNTPTSSSSPSSNSETCATDTKPANNPNTATIGVGASLGVALLIALGLLGWRERAWRSRPVQEKVVYVKGDQQGSFVGSGGLNQGEKSVRVHPEQSSGPQRYEMGYGHEHQEMEARPL